MSLLQEKMAIHGFESNDDYEYQVRCLIRNPADGIRCLNVEGDSTRRKTAFAYALAQALEYPHILYHDFTQQNPPQAEIILPPSKDERGLKAADIEPLDQIVSEACAFSLAEDTILILDQLQAADFREHIRIYKLLQNAEWQSRDATYYAHRKHFLVFLISEDSLYHSLQKSSFRVWVKRVSDQRVDYQPAEFGLGEEAREMMQALAELFDVLGVTPTRSEYRKLLNDVHMSIRTGEYLRHSIYGWTEGVDRTLLYSDELTPLVQKVTASIQEYIGVDEMEMTLAEADGTAGEQDEA